MGVRTYFAKLEIFWKKCLKTKSPWKGHLWTFFGNLNGTRWYVQMVLSDFCEKIKISRRRWPGYCGIALHVCSFDDDPHSRLKLNSASWILSPPLFCVQAGSRDDTTGGCRDPAVSVSIVLLLSGYLSLLLALHCVWLNVMMLGLGRDLVTPSCKRCWALVLVCLGSEHIRSLSIKPDGPQLERKILLNISRVQIWLLKAEVSAQPSPAQPSPAWHCQFRRVKH